MSWDNLARALHDDLCDTMGCAEYFPPEVGSYVEHGLGREFWKRYADWVRWVVPRKTYGESVSDRSFRRAAVNSVVKQAD